ncbi:MAG: SDR family oxidoreductase [Phycisphaerales bacterium]|nr:MAG: SDR family oxidoreductase [Phycisphaerales bacterium]
MSGVKGRVVIVTGASSGIGEAAAAGLVRRGARVAMVARRGERLAALIEKLRGEGAAGEAAAFECDVTSRDGVRAMVERVEGGLGPVDALVNNAGVMINSFVEKEREEEWARMVDVNINGVLHCTAAVIGGMLARGSGHFVNVSSVAGRRLFPGAAVYCATKHFVHAFSEGLRSEVTKHGLRVTVVAPGLVETELHDHATDPDMIERAKNRPPMRWLTSEDVAREIVHAMEAPAHVSVNEVLMRPTDQEN